VKCWSIFVLQLTLVVNALELGASCRLRQCKGPHFLVHWRSSGSGFKKQGLTGTARLAHASTLHGQVLESGLRRATQIEKSISSKTVVRFGPFEADFRAGELRKHGVKLKLVGQPFEVLAMLLERPGQLVTREELRAKLWPTDAFVDFDHGLNAAVNKLRDALSDSAEKPNYVETLPRRGYRFISAVGLHDSQNFLGEPSSPKMFLIPR
jgi:DNA-binding winged helix-turn-helix (wHTH) protein